MARETVIHQIANWMLKGQTNSLNDAIHIGKVSYSKGKVHPCTGAEALYRPYGP